MSALQVLKDAARYEAKAGASAVWIAELSAAHAAVKELAAAVRAERQTVQGSQAWQLAHDRVTAALARVEEAS